MNIYNSNLIYNIQDEDQRKLYTVPGTVSSVKVILDIFSCRGPEYY